MSRSQQVNLFPAPPPLATSAIVYPKPAMPTTPPDRPSLDTYKLNVEIEHEDTAEQAYRFRSCPQDREFWLDLLPRIELSSKRIERFLQCGIDAWVVYSPSRQQFNVRCVACNLRICPVCSRRLREDAAGKIKNAIRSIPPEYLKFVTLTLQHSSAPLKLQLKNLRKAFRRLRQRKIWKENVKWGYATIECTFNAETGHWHPHLHILAHAKFIPQDLLSQAWRKVTHGSYIVDIRQVKDPETAGDYVASYIAKPPKLDNLDDPKARMTEYYQALEGSRLLIPFGKPPAPPEETAEFEPQHDWIPVAKLKFVLTTCQAGNTDAAHILKSLEERLNSELIYLDHDPPPTDLSDLP